MYIIFRLEQKLGQEYGPLIRHSGKVCQIAYSPDGNQLASSSRDFTIRIWNVITGFQIGEVIKDGNSNVQYFRLQYNQIAQCTVQRMDNSLHLAINLLFQTKLSEFKIGKDQNQFVTSLAVDLVRFSLNQQLIVFTTKEPGINILEVSTGQLKGQFRVGNSLGQTEVIFTQDESTIISGNIFDGIRMVRLDKILK